MSEDVNELRERLGDAERVISWAIDALDGEDEVAPPRCVRGSELYHKLREHLDAVAGQDDAVNTAGREVARLRAEVIRLNVLLTTAIQRHGEEVAGG